MVTLKIRPKLFIQKPLAGIILFKKNAQIYGSDLEVAV
jgi:hypothetical protein